MGNGLQNYGILKVKLTNLTDSFVSILTTVYNQPISQAKSLTSQVARGAGAYLRFL